MLAANWSAGLYDLIRFAFPLRRFSLDADAMDAAA